MKTAILIVLIIVLTTLLVNPELFNNAYYWICLLAIPAICLLGNNGMLGGGKRDDEEDNKGFNFRRKSGRNRVRPSPNTSSSSTDVPLVPPKRKFPDPENNKMEYDQAIQKRAKELYSIITNEKSGKKWSSHLEHREKLGENFDEIRENLIREYNAGKTKVISNKFIIKSLKARIYHYNWLAARLSQVEGDSNLLQYSQNITKLINNIITLEVQNDAIDEELYIKSIAIDRRSKEHRTAKNMKKQKDLAEAIEAATRGESKGFKNTQNRVKIDESTVLNVLNEAPPKRISLLERLTKAIGNKKPNIQIEHVGNNEVTHFDDPNGKLLNEPDEKSSDEPSEQNKTQNKTKNAWGPEDYERYVENPFDSGLRWADLE
jgi:hypothetical protein